MEDARVNDTIDRHPGLARISAGLKSITDIVCAFTMLRAHQEL